MTVDVITIFPEMVRHALDEGIIGRAVARDVVEIGVRDLRARGWSAEEVIGHAAHLAGLTPTTAPIRAVDVARWF